MRGSAYGAIGGSATSNWSLRISTVCPALGRSLNGTAVPFGRSIGLYGVLKSGGLLAGSALTLDIEGVSNCPTLRLVVPFLIVELGRGVLGASPSNLR